MNNLLTQSQLRVLSGLFTDLAAGWVGAIIIFSNLTELTERSDQATLLLNAILAIVCLQIAFKLDKEAST